MNPILAMLNAQNPTLQALKMISNPNEAFNNLMQSNPQFKNFVEANRGKSAEQIARENGVDFSTVKQIASASYK